MKKISIMFALILMAFFCAPVSAEVRWSSLKEGMEKAKVGKKPMIDNVKPASFIEYLEFIKGMKIK